MEAVERLIGRLYSSFVMRDLSLLVSGGLVISVFLAPFKIIDFLLDEKNNPWIVIPVYLALAYVLGVLLQEAALCVLRHFDKTEKDGQYLIVLMEDIYHNCHFNTVIAIERILYFKQIGSTFSSSLFAVFVGLLLYQYLEWIKWDWWPQLALLLIIILIGICTCVHIYFRFSSVETEVIGQLHKEVRPKPKENLTRDILE